MIITKDKIIEFFGDRCSAEEADEIFRYLQKNPHWISVYFNEEEWDTFVLTEDLPQSWSQNLLEKIKAAKSPREGRIGWIGWMMGLKAVAVITGILVGLVTIRQLYVKKDGPSVVFTALSTDAGIDTSIINRTGKLQRVALEDGSAVELSPASRLTFHRGFQRNKRTVFLSGEALFSVAKDKSRPFTVFTRGFSTTALGTQFRISAYADSITACVQLLKGRVMVRNLGRSEQTAYLLAGQQCTFNNAKNSLSSISAVQLASSSYANEAVPDRSGASSSEDNDREILFKNQPLTSVLSKLSEFYHTPISFDRDKLNKRKFTGSVQKDQTLEDALKIITLLNDLHVDRKDSVYRVMMGPK